MHSLKSMKSLLMLFFALLLVSSCKKDDNPASGGGGGTPTNSFTVNGAGYNNRTFTVPSSLNIPGFPGPAIGFYDNSDSVTVCFQLVEATSPKAVRTACISGFLGNRTGTYQSASLAAGFELYVEGRKFVGGFEGQNVISGTSATINVTRYDNVGGRIQGSYSGTLREEVDGALTNTTISLTGNFDVLRISTTGGGGNRFALPATQATQAE